MSVNDTSRIAIDNSTAMLQIVVSLTDDSRGIIYDRNMFIAQAQINPFPVWMSIDNLLNVRKNHPSGSGQSYKIFHTSNLLFLC